MRFSIIVPVYNAEKYIEQSIQSVLVQTNQDYEIVLVDDGSVDSSGRICDRFAIDYPDKIKVIHKENQGQLATRVMGIENAQGEYCLFLDADDTLVEGALLELEGYIEEYHSPDIIAFPFYYDKDGRLEKSQSICEGLVFFEGEELKRIYEFFLYGTLMNSVCTKAVRKDIALKSIGEYEKYTSLRCAEDRYQSMMMIRCIQNLLYINTPYYNYRMVDGSTTRQFSYKSIERFNTAVMYGFEKRCFDEWELDIVEWEKQLEANWFSYPLYVMDLFYNQVNWKERANILKYPWSSFIPEEIRMENVKSNKYVNETKLQVWDWILNRKYNRLKIYFIKKKIYKNIRCLKRKIIK